MSGISRRDLLASSAIAAAAAPSGWHAALAAAPASGRQASGFYRYRVGDYEMTAINDGVWLRTIDDKFVSNVPYQDVQKALADSFQPVDKLPIPFTSLVVNTGSKLVLIDAGTGGQLTQLAPQSGTWDANFAAAGFDPKNVDTILISHFHQDHINGLRQGRRVALPQRRNSCLGTSAFDGRCPAERRARRHGRCSSTRRDLADITKDVKRFEPGDEVAPASGRLPLTVTPGPRRFCDYVGRCDACAQRYVAQSMAVRATSECRRSSIPTLRRRRNAQEDADRAPPTACWHKAIFPVSASVTSGGRPRVRLIPVMWQASL
jgi:glyoxylase-like metal-dependent hydrolase (beta-lactamase superfamily II)